MLCYFICNKKVTQLCRILPIIILLLFKRIRTDGFCSADNFKIICQFEDEGKLQEIIQNLIFTTSSIQEKFISNLQTIAKQNIFFNLDLFSTHNTCFSDNMFNEGNVFGSKYLISSGIMCQFECQNVKGSIKFKFISAMKLFCM